MLEKFLERTDNWSPYFFATLKKKNEMLKENTVKWGKLFGGLFSLPIDLPGGSFRKSIEVIKALV